MKARDNPFNSDRVDNLRYRLDGSSWTGLMERLKKMGYRAAITGPHGSGKTTLLEELERRLRILGFGTNKLFLNREKRSFEKRLLDRFLDELGENDIILFDGADLMGRLDWRRFKQRTSGAAGLILVTHKVHLLPLLVKCSTSLRLLEDILKELLGEQAENLGVTTKALFNKHRGNIRNILRELYDLYASRDDFNNIIIE